MRQPELANAVRGGRLQPRPRAHPGRGSAAPAKPGIYERPAAADALSAALRHGTVVIRYRPALDGDAKTKLRAIQGSVPSGTILMPAASDLTGDVTIAAYGRTSSPARA